MNSLIERVKAFLQGNIEDVNTVVIIPHVTFLPRETTMPAIGVLDGGDEIKSDCSETIEKETVFISIYHEISGNREECVLKIIDIARQVKTALIDTSNFESTGYFNDYFYVDYKGSGEVKSAALFKENDEKESNFLCLKILRFEYQKHSVSV